MEKDQFLRHDEVLRYEEMVGLVGTFAALGIKKVRITGGEPLIKKNLTGLIKMLRDIDGLEEISMTTNGVYLKNMASQLKEAGLSRINISLNTIKRERYRFITGGDCFEDVWLGVSNALKAGLQPVKLNVVVMRGINDDEILDFVRLTFKYSLSVRFIEFFPTSERSDKLACYLIRGARIKQRIEDYFGRMERFFGIKGNGPAEYYRLKDSKGAIGFINSFSTDFCSECNRVRVDCAGRISPCLFSGHIYDLGQDYRNGKNRDALVADIKNVIEMKSRYNRGKKHACRVEMSSIGG